MLRRYFLTSVAVLTGLAMLGTASPAEAAFKVRVFEGSTLVYTAVDNGAGDTNAGSTVGAISFNYSDTVVAFSVIVGQSKPLFGNTPSVAAMDIAINGTFGTGGTLTIDITDTDFTPPGNPAGSGVLTAKIGSSAPAGTTFTGYLNGDDPNIAGPQGNKEFGGIDGPLTGTLITAGPASAPGNLVVSAGGTAFAPYSMTARTVFSGGAGSGFSLDNTLTFSVPAPAGLVLAATGLPVFGLGAWVRRRRVAIAA